MRKPPHVTLAYAVRLYPTANKASVLPLYIREFQRLHGLALDELLTRAWEQGHAGFPLGGLSQKGRGEFQQRALYRAQQDLVRTAKAGKARPYRWDRKAEKRAENWIGVPFLKAEMLTAAEVQTPRRAKSWDLWVHLEGTPKDQIYLPANRHRALNRALAFPGATLSQSAEVYRRNGKWYARVFVTVPLPVVVESGLHPLGCDVGVRKAVCTSDGYRGPNVRPILARMRDRNADRQRRGHEKQTVKSYQRSQLAHEARRIVSVAQKTGRGVACEDPTRLIRWKQHAAKHFASRVVLLGQLMGVSVALVPPAYTSQTCGRCGSRESTVRLGEDFWCESCRRLTDADTNAARVISRMAHDIHLDVAQENRFGAGCS
jgi:transposase